MTSVSGVSELIRCVNPVGECQAGQTPLASRLHSLQGKSIGFIDNIKPNVGLFLTFIEEKLRADYSGIETHSVRKSGTAAKLIANELEGKVHAVVNAWGD